MMYNFSSLNKVSLSLSLSHTHTHSLTHTHTHTHTHYRLVYSGANSIDVPVKSYHVLFIEEVLHPFYIFQILATIFWIADDYYLYAGELASTLFR